MAEVDRAPRAGNASGGKTGHAAETGMFGSRGDEERSGGGSGGGDSQN